jgi:acyl-CoA reductase-like NAD-dependent aldehyde dehydrogenase
VTATVPDTDDATLEAALVGLAASSPALADTCRAERAAGLRAVADALDAAAEDLVAVAARETWLPVPRLTGEVARTTGQLRMTAIRRFLRPVTYQDVPAALLDEMLQDRNPAGIPRRLDRRLSTGDLTGS